MAVQFGVNLRAIESADEFARTIRRIDALGFDLLAAPDHLGAPAPFGVLAAAAQLSPRIRLRTYVLNAGFHNAALLAREAATLDLISGGRAEIGLGAGHSPAEHADAGIAYPRYAERVEALDALATELRERLSSPEHRPRPVQSPPPLMIGAMSPRGLAVAARHADVVGFAGLLQAPGEPAGTFVLASSTETDERVAQVRDARGDRTYRADALLQFVVCDRDPAQAASEVAATMPPLAAKDLLASPFGLFAPDPQAAALELRLRHERYGFDGFTTHQPNLEALGEVAAAYREGR